METDNSTRFVFWMATCVLSLTLAITFLATSQTTTGKVVLIVGLLLLFHFSMWRSLVAYGMSFRELLDRLELTRRDLLLLVIPSLVSIFVYYFRGTSKAAAAWFIVLFCEVVLKLTAKSRRDWKNKYGRNKGLE